MNILMLSTIQCSGGAAQAALRLHHGLVAAGADAGLLVRDVEKPMAGVYAAAAEAGLHGRVGRPFWRRVNKLQLMRYPSIKKPGREKFSHYRGWFDIGRSALLQQAEVINLHWVADYFFLHRLLERVPARTPIVWTLHDLNPMTGGCHYAGECRRFEACCGRCPQLESSLAEDLSFSGFRYKQDALSRLESHRLTVVTPSAWLGRESRSSSLLGRFRHEVIPYGIDLVRFRPMDTAAARAELGLDARRPVVLLLADALDNQRKAMDLAVSALTRIPPRRRPLVLAAGTYELSLPDSEVINLGYLDGEEALRRAYSAANLYVVPSREDNLPNTVIESLACGTPVVAFDIGGMPDLVTPGRTGQLAAPYDVDGLAACIEQLLVDAASAAGMRAACRQDAERRFPLALQARAYLDLFEALRQGRPAG